MSLSYAEVNDWACLAFYIYDHPEVAPEYTIASVKGDESSWERVYARYLHPNVPVVLQGVGSDWPVREWALTAAHANKVHTSACSCLDEESCIDNIHFQCDHRATSHATQPKPTIADFYAHTRALVHHAVTSTSPNLSILQTRFGRSEVSVVSCGEQEFNSQRRACATMADYAHQWQAYRCAARDIRKQRRHKASIDISAGATTNGSTASSLKVATTTKVPTAPATPASTATSAPALDASATTAVTCSTTSKTPPGVAHASPSSAGAEASAPTSTDSTEYPLPFWEYCRDWHCLRDFPDVPLYAPPAALTDDWLNTYWDFTAAADAAAVITATTNTSTASVADAGVAVAKATLGIAPADTATSTTTSPFARVDAGSGAGTGASTEFTVPPLAPPSTLADDYRFVYAGPHSSWTPLHRDVFGSYSWSANVAGAKLWVFLPPEARALTDAEGSPCCDAYEILEVEGMKRRGFPDLAEIMQRCKRDLEARVLQHWRSTRGGVISGGDGANAPASTPDEGQVGELTNSANAASGRIPPDTASDASPENSGVTPIRPLLFLQRQGDVLFVPSLYAHQVCNLSDCISVNHNWVNAHCARMCAQQLKRDLADVRDSLCGWGSISDDEEDSTIQVKDDSARKNPDGGLGGDSSASCSDGDTPAPAPSASAPSPSLHRPPALSLLDRVGTHQRSLHAQSGANYFTWMQVATVAALAAAARTAAALEWCALPGEAPFTATSPLRHALAHATGLFLAWCRSLSPLLRRTLWDLCAAGSVSVCPSWMQALRSEPGSQRECSFPLLTALHSHVCAALPCMCAPQCNALLGSASLGNGSLSCGSLCREAALRNIASLARFESLSDIAPPPSHPHHSFAYYFSSTIHFSNTHSALCGEDARASDDAQPRTDSRPCSILSRVAAALPHLMVALHTVTMAYRTHLALMADADVDAVVTWAEHALQPRTRVAEKDVHGATRRCISNGNGVVTLFNVDAAPGYESLCSADVMGSDGPLRRDAAALLSTYLHEDKFALKVNAAVSNEVSIPANHNAAAGKPRGRGEMADEGAEEAADDENDDENDDSASDMWTRIAVENAVTRDLHPRLPLHDARGWLRRSKDVMCALVRALIDGARKETMCGGAECGSGDVEAVLARLCRVEAEVARVWRVQLEDAEGVSEEW